MDSMSDEMAGTVMIRTGNDGIDFLVIYFLVLFCELSTFFDDDFDFAHVFEIVVFNVLHELEYLFHD